MSGHVSFSSSDVSRPSTSCTNVRICKERVSYWFTYILYKFLGAFAKLPKAIINFVMSVCPSVRMEQIGCHWTDFSEIWWGVFFNYLSRNFKFHYTLTRITGTLHEDLCTFKIKYHWIILRMRNVSDKFVEKSKHSDFFLENRAVREIIWKNTVQPDRPQVKLKDCTCVFRADN
jgi:hypothetical protein